MPRVSVEKYLLRYIHCTIRDDCNCYLILCMIYILICNFNVSQRCYQHGFLFQKQKKKLPKRRLQNICHTNYCIHNRTLTLFQWKNSPRIQRAYDIGIHYPFINHLKKPGWYTTQAGLITYKNQPKDNICLCLWVILHHCLSSYLSSHVVKLATGILSPNITKPLIKENLPTPFGFL